MHILRGIALKVSLGMSPFVSAENLPRFPLGVEPGIYRVTSGLPEVLSKFFEKFLRDRFHDFF